MNNESIYFALYKQVYDQTLKQIFEDKTRLITELQRIVEKNHKNYKDYLMQLVSKAAKLSAIKDYYDLRKDENYSKKEQETIETYLKALNIEL